MVASLLALGLFVLLLATRSRLERAERTAQEHNQLVLKLAAELREQAQRLARLEQRVGEQALPEGTRLPPMAARLAQSEATTPAPAEPSDAALKRAQPPAAPLPESASLSAGAIEHPVSATRPSDASIMDPRPQVPAAPAWSAVAMAALRELLFGGNTVVRAGIVVLLVGVVLLLRWATEHALFPIELRLAAVGVVALAFTAFGLRERERRPGFALTLQGGGIAAQYLVVFFAYRSYALLPPALAFGLLCAIAFTSGVLSVRQNSRSLAFIGQLFAFAAPLLTASDQGSHVALFSYYLLLNGLVFALAFFKAWRALNLLGFVFTFGVATAWGALRYEPRLFASTEPFLIAFFALYVAIPVLFALRHPTAHGGWVDGSLVFGTPLSALALQWSLVHDRPFAMAYSVLALAAVYIGLVLFIRRRAPERLAALGEAFLPIGVGFATLAIPYGLDDPHLTGAAWALEGAGLYWVGVRQQRWLSRAAGALLCLLAGAAASLEPGRAATAWPVVNSWFLASALIGTSALFVAGHAYVRRSQLRPREWRAAQVFIVWGVAFWLRAGYGELAARLPPTAAPGSELALLALLGLALETIARRVAWTPGRVPALLLWPAMAVYLSDYAWSLELQPLARWGVLGWPLMAAAMIVVLRRFVDTQPRLKFAHASAVWLWALWCVVLCEHGVTALAQLDASYGAGAADLSVALWGLAILVQSRGTGWPSGVHKAQYLRPAMAGLMLLGAARAGYEQLALAENTAPLPYLPVLNPLDLSALIGAAVCLLWLRELRTYDPALCGERSAQRGVALVALLLFAWWNTQLARSVHHYAGVAFDPDELFHSSALQLGYSLSWTVIALAVMWTAHKRSLRAPWMAAAGLLAVVLAKLFLLDLSRLSTPTKIVSFLGVGGLLLLIGYVAPVPPRRMLASGPTGPLGVQP